MKKAVAVLLCAMIMLSAGAPCCLAAEGAREYFDDGSYIVVSYDYPEIELPDNGTGGDDSVSADDIEQAESSENFFGRFLKAVINFIKKLIGAISNQKKVSETKYASYYDSRGTLLWTVRVKAEFAYNGKSSVCNSVSAGYIGYDSDWKLISKEAFKNGSSASAHFTVKQYKLGVPLKTIEKTVSISCDKDGNIK